MSLAAIFSPIIMMYDCKSNVVKRRLNFDFDWFCRGDRWETSAFDGSITQDKVPLKGERRGGGVAIIHGHWSVFADITSALLSSQQNCNQIAVKSQQQLLLEVHMDSWRRGWGHWCPVSVSWAQDSAGILYLWALNVLYFPFLKGEHSACQDWLVYPKPRRWFLLEQWSVEQKLPK